MPPRKRQAPATPKQAAQTASGRRRSQRLGSSTKKSQYFESGSESESDDEPASKRAKTAGAGARGTGRRGPKPESDESEDDYKAPDEDDDDDEDEEEQDEDASAGEKDDEEEEDRKPKSRNAAKPGKGARGRGKAAKADDDDNEDVDDPDSRVTFIPHKKLRDTGGVEYADDRLHPNTLLFLKDLKANNRREWLKSNDREYRRSLEDWNSFVETLQERLMAEDETLPQLPVKDITFRIYRDIRFSKDSTPYKPYYSVAFSRTGRKGPYACYYVHVEPGKAFVGGGLWHPEADALHRLRASIDERPRRWRRALSSEPFRKVFLPKSKPGDEKTILKAFAQANTADALKTKPKGFNADHRDIQLLKLRNFTVSKQVPDELFNSDDVQDQIGEIVGAMVGFVTHLNSIVMPDDPDADEGDDDEEDEGEDGGDSTE